MGGELFLTLLPSMSSTDKCLRPALDRLSAIGNQISGTPGGAGKAKILEKHADDVSPHTPCRLTASAASDG